jgi:hypothetical protein
MEDPIRVNSELAWCEGAPLYTYLRLAASQEDGEEVFRRAQRAEEAQLVLDVSLALQVHWFQGGGVARGEGRHTWISLAVEKV